MEDNQIIKKILNGDKKAENILYVKYKKFIFNVLQTKTKYNCNIEDDISEIMIKIFLNLKHYNSEKSSFKTWVVTIIKNHLIDKWRLYKEVNITSIDDYSGQCLDNTLFEVQSTLDYISKTISTDEYNLLRSKYFHGFNYNEIGRELNEKETSVSNRVSYIKRKIKEKMGECV